MIKPDAYTKIGKIIDIIIKNGFTISRMKMFKWTLEQAQGFYAEHKGKSFFNDLANFMSSDVAVGFELVADNAVQKWRELIGPTNSLTARSSAPKSIRALFGTDGQKNAVHGSDSGASAAREIAYVFNSEDTSSTALFNNCTCLMIKPDAVKAGYTGQIIDIVLEEGFEISALEQFKLNRPAAEEFFEVYKGVVPEYTATVEHVTTGPVVVMEVRQENAVQALRELVGPHDPEIAKHLRKNTIRAKFGIDRVSNAVHCTDLPEDGILECEYFFKIQKGK
jgi:nucleoside-diphosphate kinase